jgi:5-methylthioadenosine/S-adenosylhomocysteine deaminase
MTITLIRSADWAAVWNPEKARHEYRRGVDICFSGDKISYVGPKYTGQADRVIDGTRLFVMPGLINIHTHLMAENLGRGIIEELGNPALYMSGLYDEKALFLATNLTYQTDSSDQATRVAQAATKIGAAELLKSGVTTVVDLSVIYDGWVDTLSETGIRAYVAPMYRQARWRVPKGY